MIRQEDRHMIRDLSPEQLMKVCDPGSIGAGNSSQIGSLKTIIGQERAVKALRFGLGIKENGFNV